MKITMIGLGKMGMGIAENLLRHNHQVNGIDIDQKVEVVLTKLGGTFFYGY